MSTAAKIEAKLRAALAPVRLAISDDSARHAGHAGAQPGGETHFSVEIVSAEFTGKSRVLRHSMVYELLADEIAGGVHALAVKALTPGEDI